jgi:mannose-1-phosphate guanylyltransferase / phosphomannomutase
MKAVVMAGGEGTRLRPLTSNQPKPMVPIVGKPCIEHILELLRSHGLHDVLITLAFLPQAIRSYFGDGESLGMSIDYSVEDSPLGTAGSVRLAADKLDETFLVISGDALCDVNLSKLIAFHRERGAAVTIGLKSVENPLEFGIVVTDEDGRIERFLEKPSWGQVFSDTINTGIYVIEPEVLRRVPDDRPYDFSKELFPLLLEMGRPLYGYVLEGYWQDVGDLGQYAQANFDALDGHVKLDIPGLQIRGNIWLSENAEVDDLAQIEGPALVGNYCRISPEARVGPHSVLSANVTLRERARTARSVVDASTHVGASSLIEGAVIGRRCDIRRHVRIHESAVLGDDVTVGAESVIMPGVLVYPNKEIESGAQIHENLIWEQRATARLFERDVISGLIDVDLTPEVAVRIAAALGTSLGRGSQVVSSRGPSTAARMIQRAMISGLNSTGVDVADIRVLPAAVGRHLVKLHGYEAGFHVGVSAMGDELVQIRMFEHPGVEISTATQKEVEKHFSRSDARRAPYNAVGDLDYPARVRESYAEDLLASLDTESIRRSRFRLVIDYGYSPAAAVTPLVLGPLKAEVVSARGFPDRASRADGASLRETVGQTKRLVDAVGADVGVAFDVLGERIFLVDEKADEIPVEHALLLYLALLRESGRSGKVVVPATVTSQAESVLDGSALEVVRTVGSLAELTKASAADGVIFAGAPGGGYVFPEFLPAYDATASLCKLLELLAPVERPLSELVAELPSSTLVHRPLQCPWAMKGTVMRELTERLRGREVDLVDGIKVFDDRGWAQVQPDPDQPLLHLYSEGRTEDESVDLEEELRRMVQEVMKGQEAVARR